MKPRAAGETPMGTALTEAYKRVRSGGAKTGNRESFPTVIINITDGEASDADAAQLRSITDKIRAVRTEDGNVLLFNIHLAATENGSSAQVSSPSRIEQIPPHSYARILYDISSEVPECYNEMILHSQPGTRPPFRAMGYNCALNELFSMLSIGSLSVSMTA